MTTPRRSQRGNRTVDAILVAAEPQFLAHGFVGTKIDDIAEAAQVSVGTVYLHFHSKDGLYTAVLLRAQDLMIGEYLDPVFDLDLPPWQRIEAWCQAYMRFFHDHEPRLRLMALTQFGDVSLGPEELDAQLRAGVADAHRRLVELFVEASDAGQLRDLDPQEVSRFVWAGVYGMCLLNMRHENLQFDPDGLRSSLSSGLRLLSEGYGPAPAGGRFQRPAERGQIDA